LVGAVLPIVAAIPKQNHLSYRTSALIVVPSRRRRRAGHQRERRPDPAEPGRSFALTYTTAVAFDHGLWPTGIAAAVQTQSGSGGRDAAARFPSPPRSPTWQMLRPEPDGPDRDGDPRLSELVAALSGSGRRRST
jgi:hypothetical protein